MRDYAPYKTRRGFFETPAAPFVVVFGSMLAVGLVDPVLRFFGL